jgi:hypothetical protein
MYDRLADSDAALMVPEYRLLVTDAAALVAVPTTVSALMLAARPDTVPTDSTVIYDTLAVSDAALMVPADTLLGMEATNAVRFVALSVLMLATSPNSEPTDSVPMYDRLAVSDAALMVPEYRLLVTDAAALVAVPTTVSALMLAARPDTVPTDSTVMYDRLAVSDAALMVPTARLPLTYPLANASCKPDTVPHTIDAVTLALDAARKAALMLLATDRFPVMLPVDAISVPVLTTDVTDAYCVTESAWVTSVPVTVTDDG